VCVVKACDFAREVRDEDGNLLRRDCCADCPLDKLDHAVSNHPALGRVFDLDFALNAGFQIGLDDVDVEEFRCLKALRIERDRFQREQEEKARRQR
jgi:hypothetical protein